MQSSDAKILTGQLDIVFGDQLVVGCLSGDTDSVNVVLGQDEEIPPKSEKVVIGSVTSPNPEVYVVLNPSCTREGVQVGLVFVRASSSIPVRILNLDKRPKVLPRETHLCKLTPAVLDASENHPGTPNRLMFGREVSQPQELFFPRLAGKPTNIGEYLEHLGESLRMSHDIARRFLNNAREKQKRLYNVNVYKRSFVCGDLVYLKKDARTKGKYPNLIRFRKINCHMSFIMINLITTMQSSSQINRLRNLIQPLVVQI